MTNDQQIEWGQLVARANRRSKTKSSAIIGQSMLIADELILSIDKNMKATDDLLAEILTEIGEIHKTMVMLKSRS